MILDYEELFTNNPRGIYGILFLFLWPFWSLWIIYNKSISIQEKEGYLKLINVLTGKSERILTSDIKGYYIVYMSEYLVFVDTDSNNLFSIHEPFYKNPYPFIESLDVPYLGWKVLTTQWNR